MPAGSAPLEAVVGVDEIRPESPQHLRVEGVLPGNPANHAVGCPFPTHERLGGEKRGNRVLVEVPGFLGQGDRPVRLQRGDLTVDPGAGLGKKGGGAVGYGFHGGIVARRGCRNTAD